MIKLKLDRLAITRSMNMFDGYNLYYQAPTGHIKTQCVINANLVLRQIHTTLTLKWQLIDNISK